MSRAPEQLAPSWLPRQQRRRINRQLHRLLHQGICSVCGDPLKHNSQTTSGLDAQGNVVVAGKCCASQVAIVFGLGLYSERHYDFLQPRDSKPGVEPTNEQILDAIAAYQQAIADSDKQLADIERRGGGIRPTHIITLDRPWKNADRDWFRQNPERAHHMRMPFPGELDEEVPAGHALIILLRQIEPGTRLKVGLCLNTNWLPLPDDEATTHALFEVAVGREAVPPDRQALCTLVEKYTARRGPL